MYQIIMMFHVLAAACIIILVLVQQGRGATIGSAFGSGASQTVFGSRGSGSFLLKVTIGFVVLFFATSISLNYLASQMVKQSNDIVLPVPQKNVEMPLPVTPNSIPTTAAPVGVDLPVVNKEAVKKK
jgi:preprotein translocase subunit SecG